MRAVGRLCLATLAAISAAGPSAAAVPALRCRHFLATVGHAGDMPYSVVQSLKPWMSLHLARPDDDSAAARARPAADFQWAAESGAHWIVVYSTDRGSAHFTLFAPVAPHSAIYRQVVPSKDQGAWFSDPTCRGIDAALKAYGEG